MPDTHTIKFPVGKDMLLVEMHEYTVHFAAPMECYVQRCGLCGQVLVDNTNLAIDHRFKATGYAKGRPVFTSGSVRTIIIPPHFNLCPGLN